MPRASSPLAFMLATLAAGGLLLGACASDREAAPMAATATTAAFTAPTVSLATPAGPSPAATPSAAAAPTEVLALPCPTTATPAQTEGPYYTSNPPERASLLEAGMAGTRIVITGFVFDAACRPLASARVDFWQADAAGGYDNTGYRLRGYQLTDAQGRYRLETVVPGEYPGRTEHIHVKLTPPGGQTLTSQLYFPDAARNASDGIFNAALVLTNVQRAADGRVTANYHFRLP